MVHHHQSHDLSRSITVVLSCRTKVERMHLDIRILTLSFPTNSIAPAISSGGTLGETCYQRVENDQEHESTDHWLVYLFCPCSV
jgi:hypothetical protein